MSTFLKVARLVDNCAYGDRMPGRAEVLAISIQDLSGRELRCAKALMRRECLPERMARRATEISHFNPEGAFRIVNAMSHLFRPSRVLEALQTANYLEKQAARAARHQAGGNHTAAHLIRLHLSELLEDSDELARLLERHQLVPDYQSAT